jgi:hypothetical protein
MTRARLSQPFATVLLTLSLTQTGPASSAEARLEGDIGLGATRSQAQVLGLRPTTGATPYLNFEYGPVFARVDSFGVKTLPLGLGHIELVGQYRSDGYTSDLLSRRKGSVPLGVGTLQITPIGAFGVQVLHDLGQSGGNLVQVRYLTQWALGRVTLYPDLGAEYQSRAYTGYYFGTTAADAATLGQAYRPGAAVNPYIGAMVEMRLAGDWYLNAYARRSIADDEIARSPLVTQRGQNMLLLAMTRRL